MRQFRQLHSATWLISWRSCAGRGPELLRTGAERVIQTREGTVIVAGMSQHWNGKEPVNDPQNWNQFSYIVRSEDSGRSWSPMERFTGPEGTMVIGVAQMSNGELLWYGGTTNDKGEPVRATMVRHEKNIKVRWEPTADLNPC